MSFNYSAIIQLQACRKYLTTQQYKTLKGQVLAGDAEGALRGLRTILKRKEAAQHGQS